MTLVFRVLKLVYALLLFSHVKHAAALATNRTIDDENGDSVTGALPTYSPQNIWTQGNKCSTCFAQPNYQRAFDHTWHDATIHTRDPQDELSVTMMFTGTAVYAYCILVNNITFTTFTNLTFSINGTQVGSFSHTPNDSGTYLYNTLVYANASIPNGNHTFVIHSPRGTDNSFVMFDYVQYTYDPDSIKSPTAPALSSATSTSSAPTVTATASSHVAVGAIAGGTVAGVALLALIAGAFTFLYCRRRNRKTRWTSNTASIAPSTSPWQSTIARFSQQLVGHDQQQSDIRRPFLHRSSDSSSSQRPLPFVVSNPDTIADDDEVPVPSRSQLLHQLEDHQRQLASLQGRSSKHHEVSEMSQTNVQSQVEDLRLEVARLREMMANMDTTAPPEYHD